MRSRRTLTAFLLSYIVVLVVGGTLLLFRALASRPTAHPVEVPTSVVAERAGLGLREPEVPAVTRSPAATPQAVSEVGPAIVPSREVTVTVASVPTVPATPNVQQDDPVAACQVEQQGAPDLVCFSRPWVADIRTDWAPYTVYVLKGPRTGSGTVATVYVPAGSVPDMHFRVLGARAGRLEYGCRTWYLVLLEDGGRGYVPAPVLMPAEGWRVDPAPPAAQCPPVQEPKVQELSESR